MKVDLNADLGEGYGIYSVGNDEKILEVVSSANVACGFHAGDPVIMEKTIKLCKKNNVSIGAHPSYPDRQGFGRRDMNLSTEEISSFVTYQVGALSAFAKVFDTKISHFKVHGALYNKACKDSKIAKCLCECVARIDDSLIFVGLANSEMIDAAKKMGLRYANEVFADRAYNRDGTLVSRTLENSVLHDRELVVKRILRMLKEGKVESIDGIDIDIKADTICVHGDTKESLEFVRDIKSALINNGIEVCRV